MKKEIRIIQTLWAKPFFKTGKESTNDRRTGGFSNKQTFFNCWALSFFQAKKYFETVVLYADDIAKEWFIDLIGLPYDEVYAIDPRIENYDVDLWAVPKLFTYQEQKQPFLHIDGDFIFLDPIKNINLSKPLFAELLDDSVSYSKKTYYETVDFMKAHHFFIPQEILTSLEKHQKYHSPNAGIIGGEKVDFFNTLAQKSIDFVDKNLDKIQTKGFNKSFFNCVFEQVLFFSLSENKQIPISYLYDNCFPLLDPPNALINLQKQVINIKFPSIHFLATSKKLLEGSHWISETLKRLHPEYFHKIYKLILEGKL